MAELPDGSILMAFNDDTVARTNLSLSRSTNGGHDWTLLATLEDSPNGSFSYPTVTYMPDLVSYLAARVAAAPPGFADSTAAHVTTRGQALWPMCRLCACASSLEL